MSNSGTVFVSEGPCPICGEHVSLADFERGEALAMGPAGGMTAAHVSHFFTRQADGSWSQDRQSPEYQTNLRTFTAAVIYRSAMQPASGKVGEA